MKVDVGGIKDDILDIKENILIGIGILALYFIKRNNKKDELEEEEKN